MTEKEIKSRQIANTYALFTAGAGLIPVPWFDVAAIAALQVKMLSDIANVYGLPLKEDRGKSLITALIGGVVPTTLGFGGVGMFLKRLPVLGPIIGVFTVSAFGAATTYAVAAVFIQHFESGGTFLDFKPEEVRGHFESEFKKAAAGPAAGPSPS